MVAAACGAIETGVVVTAGSFGAVRAEAAAITAGAMGVASNAVGTADVAVADVAEVAE